MICVVRTTSRPSPALEKLTAFAWGADAPVQLCERLDIGVARRRKLLIFVRRLIDQGYFGEFPILAQGGLKNADTTQSSRN
jgi:hypothetical protein